MTPREFQDLLIYDTFIQSIPFYTHCSSGAPSWERLLGGHRVEGSLGVDLAFECASREVSGESLVLTFTAGGQSLEVEKTYRLESQGTITVSHAVSTSLADPWFGLEFNFMVISGQRPAIGGRPMDRDRGRFSGRLLELKDDKAGARLTIESAVPWEICVVSIGASPRAKRALTNPSRDGASTG